MNMFLEDIYSHSCPVCHSRGSGNPGVTPYLIRSSRNSDVVPAKAGNYNKMELDSRFHGKPWIPHQVRNDEYVNPLASRLSNKCSRRLQPAYMMRNLKVTATTYWHRTSKIHCRTACKLQGISSLKLCEVDTCQK